MELRSSVKWLILVLLTNLVVATVNPVSGAGYGEESEALGQFVDSFETSGNVSVAVDVIRNTTLEVMELNETALFLGSWLIGWEYRKEHNITGSTSGDQTDYQVGIKVYYGSGVDGTETVSGIVFGKVYVNSNCKTDFGDIRFTHANGTTLFDYWMENKTDSDNALFWIKIDEILEDANITQIYIYYGKADATTTSSGPNTMVVWDDFDDYDIDEVPKVARGWTTDGIDANNYFKASTNPLGSGRVMKSKESGDAANTILYLLSFADAGNYSINYKIYVIDANFYDGFMQIKEGGTLIVWHCIADIGGVNIKWWDGDSKEEFNPALDITYGAWNEFEARVDTDFHLLLDGVDGDGGLAASPSVGVDSLDWRLQQNVVGEGYLDDFFIRKFVEPEPTHTSFGNESLYGGYEDEGYFTTTNYLADPLANGSTLALLVQSKLAPNTHITVQMSDDNATWGDSYEIPGDSHDLDGGLEAIDLRPFNGSGPFYLMYNLSTTDITVTPYLNQSRLITTIGNSTGGNGTTTTVDGVNWLPIALILGLAMVLLASKTKG